MQSVNFTRVYFRKTGLEMKKGVVKAKLELSAGMTEEVIRHLSWVNPPECATKMELRGEMLGQLLQIVPMQKELKQHGIELKCEEICDFKYTEEGDTPELRFTVYSQQVGAISLVEGYLRTAGLAPAEMKAFVEHQEQLPLGPVTVSITKKKGKSLVQ